MRQLAGQPAFAWTPGRLFEQDGTRSVYCQRGALERQVERAAEAGLEVRAGFELEWFIGHADAELSPAHHGPVYGPLAMLEVNEFCTQLLADLDANGIVVGQLHAEYGLAQMELAISPADPLAAADMQLLTRQTIHAAARANGLRASFAPLVTPEAAGNGWHAHSSVLRDETNLLAGGKHPHGLTAEGEAWLAGIVRELPALAAIAAPSVPSLLRRRPGYFASAYAFWGIQNREASLRFIPETALVPATAANAELKASDASGNPYLTLAALISAGLAGIAEGLTLADPINVDPGSWDEAERERRGVAAATDDDRAADRSRRGLAARARRARRAAVRRLGRRARGRRGVGRRQDARGDRRTPPLELLDARRRGPAVAARGRARAPARRGAAAEGRAVRRVPDAPDAAPGRDSRRAGTSRSTRTPSGVQPVATSRPRDTSRSCHPARPDGRTTASRIPASTPRSRARPQAVSCAQSPSSRRVAGSLSA